MISDPSRPPRSGMRALAGLVAVCVVVVGGWMALRSYQDGVLDDALSGYADRTLPDPSTPIDPALAELGAEVFRSRCASCHAVQGDSKLGPNLAGVTERRAYGWIQAMVMNPDSMTANDPIARSLKLGYGVQMIVSGGMTRPRTLAVLEFLRRADAGAGG